MDQAYDHKFEEMKKYIPFLESMIKRLENTSSASNPRQAQLDKIKSLRDLLLDKKKRMKMENLLKCEQVLVNLYSKVEQKDPLPVLKSTVDTPKPKEESEDLEVVRNKLKSVVSKLQEEQDTLPEIARASATEELCTPGSKEPALFQRRPNKTSVSPSRNLQNIPSSSKRNYTRVLVSPEPSSRRRTKDDESGSPAPLFSRRSPKASPTGHKKDKKKLSKQDQLRKAKDLNITLNVPEDSLHSLNTKDILTRIMTCSDNDVDIESLREAKRQILNELKQTGAKCDDISDLLLKSYKKKDTKKTKNTKNKKEEVEEGELSDSESEAIQSIYGNFILEGDESTSSKTKNADSSDKPRKIQICLVINPDNEHQVGEQSKDTPSKLHETDVTDFEMYDKKSASSKEAIDKDPIETVDENTKSLAASAVDHIVHKDIETSPKEDVINTETGQPAKFYIPLKYQDIAKSAENLSDGQILNEISKNASPEKAIENNSSSSSSDELSDIPTYLKTSEIEHKEGVEIPLLHEPSVATQKPKESVVSEIDILQALKKEILSETLSIPGSQSTPPLHQPKVTKVSSVQEIVPKKRISIEKYKNKTVDPAKTPIFLRDVSPVKDDNLKKQSLKLTEKECERFNFPAKLSFEDDDESVGDLSDKDISLDDVYGNLVPKSPDHHESPKTKNIPPVIIPVEPVKPTEVSSKSDIDMRMFVPVLSPNFKNSPICTEDSKVSNQEMTKINTDKTRTPLDPRVRRDFNQSINIDSSNKLNADNIPRSVLLPNNFNNSGMTPNRTPNMTSSIPPNMTPSMNACMTPSMAPHMTPIRNPNMTPNARSFEMAGRQNFEIDDNSVRKHVYAPTFPIYDQLEGDQREQEQLAFWNKSENDVDRTRNARSNSIQRDAHDAAKSRFTNYDKHSSRYNNDRRDSFNRTEFNQISFGRPEGPSTPSNPFGRVEGSTTRINPFSWSDCPSTPSNQFGRLECPLTPSHPFGRSDCPQTPSHPFGRSDCPQTPSHPFGRSDCPMTPSHPFGRLDGPQTPSHPFGRSDCPSTPIHPFGRGDMPMTPSHPFGRSEHQSRDPRLNRSSDYENVPFEDRDRPYYRDRGRSNYSQYNKSDSQRHYREKSVGRNERSNYSHDHSHRYHNREQHQSRDYENDSYSRDRSQDKFGIDHYGKVSDNNAGRKNFYRERGRSETDDKMQYSSRANVNQSKDDTDNRLSVKPHAGKSFTIDTSINTTFQGFLERGNNMKVDDNLDRRKRAASVGRALCQESRVGTTFHRESSVGRSLHRESSVGRSLKSDSNSRYSIDNRNQNTFRRARSMGRDIVASSSEKSFKDIKADFKKYSVNYDLMSKKSENIPKNEINKNDIHGTFKESFHRDTTNNRKDKLESSGSGSNKKISQASKRYSDPRINRESDKFNYRNKEIYKEKDKNVGIVYSNDNITQGKILGSGYGVKNYKIPKIKRPVEEEKPQDKKITSDLDKSSVQGNEEQYMKKLNSGKNCDQNVKNKITGKANTKVETDKNIGRSRSLKVESSKIEKRTTRLSKISNSAEIEDVMKTRKPKKTLVYNSDSDSQISQEEKNLEPDLSDKKSIVDEKKSQDNLMSANSDKGKKSKKNEKSKKEDISITESVYEKVVENNTDNTEITNKTTEERNDIASPLDSSFGVDDLEIFSDNIASDSVIDNINALIANLDNDLQPSKVVTPTDFAKNLENMLENIDSDEEVTNDKVISDDYNDISEIITNDLNNTKTSQNDDINKSFDILKNEDILNADKNSKKEMLNTNELDTATNENENKCTEANVRLSTSESLVSTTKVDNLKLLTECDIVNSENTVDNSAAPDSTNEIINKKTPLEESFPDSTNESQNDTNSMVTSSHDCSETVHKDNDTSLSISNDTTSMNSIGNILSILQNKTKLKEILDMLGDQSCENKNLKKKLEKLTEIVSDEDDDMETHQSDIPQEKQENSLSTSKESEEINVERNNKNVSGDCIPENVVNKPVDEPDVVEDASDEKYNKLKESKKGPIKRGKMTKRGKGKFRKKVTPKGLKRITRSEAKVIKPKKPSRELLQLQEDIKEMFISDEVLNATGIRMCRLAKLVDDKSSKQKDDPDPTATVVLQKLKDIEKDDDDRSIEKNISKKKPGPKKKTKPEESTCVQNVSNNLKTLNYNRPGPKSKTKIAHKSDDDDPYAFESDSVSESNYSMKFPHNKDMDSSDSENESIDSSKSCGSSDLLVEIKKKPKRKRPGWQAGIIKSKNKKKKGEVKQTLVLNNDNINQKASIVPDSKSFTDKSYCFHPNMFIYACRICSYNGEDIVNHYKQNHPYTEIPISRPSPEMAKQAIEQCEEINFQAISKMPSDKYVCRFCFKEFGRKVGALEAFFWHVVSMHTGEYKYPTTCPFNLDIPPPPKDVKGQLIGYICEKCHFTQISLENLKTHVIVRHNDEQTEVYTINLAVMTPKAINTICKRPNTDSEQQQQKQHRVLRSSRLNQSASEVREDHNDDTDVNVSSVQVSSNQSNESSSPSLHKQPKMKYQTKITFETDDSISETSSTADSITVKMEKEEEHSESKLIKDTTFDETDISHTEKNIIEPNKSFNSEGSMYVHSHFKMRHSEGGPKEYVCCINGHDYHYKTTLLISLKKHVQLKHSEVWDGYCFVCKVIVTPQGKYKFQDCLQHYIDKHMDCLPIIEPANEKPDEGPQPEPVVAQPPKPYINVRPLSELMSNDVAVEPEMPALPKIENIMSLGTTPVETPQAVPSYPPVSSEVVQEEKEYKYEEMQADVMSKKHFVVLTTMMSHNKLVNVYKCAGRFCSFTTDSAEDALLHASTHQRVGGENSLICSYCDFDCSENAIDLVMHVFKAHSVCPYVCGYCFYRAASSQVVVAHINRIHKDKSVLVLSAANITPPPFKVSSMLSREAVVQHYVCPHACKFRTYTAGKFCEHLLQRHSMEPRHPCHICAESCQLPAQLIQHMKTHDFNVYQCTWCTHGADSEGGLLLHTSQRHPDKQPQAYLRVITNKDGSSEFRVLPLASFNKTKVSVVTPTGPSTAENPVREAERSIELEKLIGHTNQMIESMAAQPPQEQAEEHEPIAEIEAAVAGITNDERSEEEPEPTPLLPEPAESAAPGPQAAPPPITPPPRPQDRSEQVRPVLKHEVDITPTKHTTDEIVCLDSDEDDNEPAPSTPVSEDSPNSSVEKQSSTPAPKFVPQAALLKCPKCRIQYRLSQSFKKHVMSCFPNTEVKCMHCEASASAEAMLRHYAAEHGQGRAPNVCGECGQRFESVAQAKQHLRYLHGASRASVRSRPAPQGQEAVVSVAVRKKRFAGTTAAAPPPKLARFGPLEAHLLPINPILDDAVFCAVCEFKTKVRLNMVRHLQQHAERQPAPSTAPVNPVPHLETNEMHFDRMLNLASSSIATRAPERAASASASAPAGALGAEAAARYPRAVAARQRLACGARGCSYISLDEGMLRRHWDALHASSQCDFRCVHCPPYQYLDRSKPLTAARIVAHLKMHDDALYACSACPFYHYRRAVVDKHAEGHEGSARSLVVREPASSSSPSASSAAAPPAAPTMDLKPWRCGVCSYYSMLRPAVAEHCAKTHQSKMQFKCMYCPFRTSACDNVTKHQTNSHPGKKPDIFYYYYREGSVPDEPDGTPRWKWQRENMAVPDVPVKSEATEGPLEAAPSPVFKSLSTESEPPLDLNIVKKEAEEANIDLAQLCATYGQLCAPNGLKYKCPLCKVVIEDTKEAMQSHLYEELNYRKWACSVCMYKAFHKTGLNEHIMSEHRGQNQPPTLLPSDANIEMWVQSVLDHQTDLIAKNKENFSKQKIITEKPTTSVEKPMTKGPEEKVSDKFSMMDLEQAFGQLGVPQNMFYCCPKCNFKVKEVAAMRDHLESELSRIRWCCSSCADKFQTYHEAQFHCKSVHVGLPSRPVEAPRDSALRAAWLAAVLQVQRLSMRCLPLTNLSEGPQPPEPDNSLLVVRYEEPANAAIEETRKRPAPNLDSDEDSRLIIDEQPPKKKSNLNCPHCDFTSRYASSVREHVYRHYDIKPFICPHCRFTGHKYKIIQHIEVEHPDEPKHAQIKYTPLPPGAPPIRDLPKPGKPKKAQEEDDNSKLLCLVCEKTMSEAEADGHSHDKEKAEFASRGDKVVICCICLALRGHLDGLQEHHTAAHSGHPLNYTFYKFLQNTQEIHGCGHCDKRFTYLKDVRSHHQAVHSSLTLRYNTVHCIDSGDESDDKRTTDAPSAPKRVARKSTSKLPSRMVARKSTAKLPTDEDDAGYSYYGTKPSPLEQYEKVTTLMYFYNTMVPFNLKKLSELIKINPVVLVEDIGKTDQTSSK